jgi:hypothetical protein
MMAEVQVVTGLKPGETYTFTTQVDGKPQTVGTFTVPAGQKELILQSIDSATTRAWEANNGWTWLELVAWFVALAVVTGFGVNILWRFARGTIDVKDIISEVNGKASLSRFQALLFTFVFVISLSLIVVRTGRFPTDVPLGEWALLAGSLGTYLVSKGMQLGLADGAAVPAGFQTGGPVLRYGDNIEHIVTGMTAEEANKKRQATNGEARFLVRAGTNGFGQPYVVASTIGKLKLTIGAQPIPNVDVKGRVRYRSATGTDVATEFGGETTIETDPASSSEVRVEFNASADNVNVPVIVKLSA